MKTTFQLQHKTAQKEEIAAWLEENIGPAKPGAVLNIGLVSPDIVQMTEGPGWRLFESHTNRGYLLECVVIDDLQLAEAFEKKFA